MNPLAAEETRQLVSTSASKLKCFAALITSRLPHEPADKKAAVMEGVGTTRALLPPLTVWVQHQQVFKCAVQFRIALE